MKPARKVKASEWLESDEEPPKPHGHKGNAQHSEFLDEEDDLQPDAARFEQRDFEDEKQGRLMFELQKSFGGDRRFRLDAR